MTRLSGGIVVGAVLLVAATACRVGFDPTTSRVATSPLGTVVRVEWSGPTNSFWSDRSELIAVTDSGLYMLHGNALVFYPIGVPARLTALDARGIGRLYLQDPEPEALADWTPYARYPFGLSDDRLQALALALGRDSIAVRSSYR